MVISLYLGLHGLTYFQNIHRYGLISRKSSVLIFGGYCDESDCSLIAQYKIVRWERVGNLQNSRQSHRTIANQDRIYIVGGEGVLYVFSDQIFRIIYNIQQNRNMVAR